MDTTALNDAYRNFLTAIALAGSSTRAVICFPWLNSPAGVAGCSAASPNNSPLLN
ncbi:hypothetical protein [Arthrobacter sp. E3]|uniref:hypothetical protein n=1 Tax=Arthrobacter sp. E3 TaxID=517402 RepID=UPI001A94F232|nr:hypothetical protein [Arthrobacter sp. E3]